MHKYQFYGSTRVGAKGQIVVPAEAREAYGIKEGDKLLILGTPGNGALIVTTPDAVERYAEKISTKLQTILDSYKEKDNQVLG